MLFYNFIPPPNAIRNVFFLHDVLRDFFFCALSFCEFVCKPALGLGLPCSKNGNNELEPRAARADVAAARIIRIYPDTVIHKIRKMIGVVIMRMRFHAPRIQMFRKRVNALTGFPQSGLHELVNDGAFNYAQLFNHAGILRLIHIVMHQPFMGGVMMHDFGWHEMCNKSKIVQ